MPLVEGDKGFRRLTGYGRGHVVDLAASSLSAARLLRKRWPRSFLLTDRCL